MKNKKVPRDAESTAAMEMVIYEQRQDSMAETVKGAREKATSILFREAGSIETLNLTRSQAEFFMLIKLKRVKDAKDYREKLDMTWAQFCESVGLSHSTIDKQLIDLKPFKSDFLSSFANFAGFDFNKIKYLAEEKFSNLAKIQGNSIIYDGREIVISPENKDEIQDVLDQIETMYKQDLEKAQSEAKDFKRIAKGKEDVIAKQVKDLRKFEKRAEGRGLSPEEDAFEQQIENLKISFDGYMSRVQPDQIEELQAADGKAITPRMRALYLTTLDYMRKQLVAAHDTAVEMFGADLEDGKGGWKQPA